MREYNIHYYWRWGVNETKSEGKKKRERKYIKYKGMERNVKKEEEEEESKLSSIKFK